MDLSSRYQPLLVCYKVLSLLLSYFCILWNTHHQDWEVPFLYILVALDEVKEEVHVIAMITPH